MVLCSHCVTDSATYAGQGEGNMDRGEVLPPDEKRRARLSLQFVPRLVETGFGVGKKTNSEEAGP